VKEIVIVPFKVNDRDRHVRLLGSHLPPPATQPASISSI
jgi:hypothetical protein